MADIFDQFETLIREHIDDAVLNLELPGDDVVNSLLATMPEWAKVGRRLDGAAGYEASYRIQVMEGGLVEGGRFGEAELTQMGFGSNLNMGIGITSGYPDPRNVPQETWLPIKVFLKRLKGNVTQDLEQLHAEISTTPIDSIAMNKLMSATSQIRHHFASHVYGDGTASLAQFAEAGTIFEAGASVVGLTVKSGTPFRFKKGQRYVIGTDASPRVQVLGSNGGGVVRCVEIDDRDRKVVFQAEAGGGNFTITADMHIMQAGLYDFTAASTAAGTLAINGFESYIKNSGTYPGTSLDVGHLHELRGYVFGNESTPENPEAALLADAIDRMTDAGVEPPPVMIAEQSVWTLYALLEKQAGATYQVPNGGTFVANGGVDGPMFTHGGKSFARLSSNRIRPNSILGLTPQAFVKLTPMGDRTVRWFKSQGGTAMAASVFESVQDGGIMKTMMQAPFDTFWELGCREPKRNFRYVGLHNQRENV